PRGRPSQARPAEHAAHLLKLSGADDAHVCDYLKAELEATIFLDASEVGKRLRACETRAAATARRAAQALLAGVTEMTLREQLAAAKELDAELATHSYLTDSLSVVRQRIEIFPKIVAGDFDHLPPIVRTITSYSAGLEIPLLTQSSFPFPINVDAALSGASKSAALISMPGWAPYWIGAPVWMARQGPFKIPGSEVR